MSDLLDAALVLTFEPVIVWLQDRFLRCVNRFTHRFRSLNYPSLGRWQAPICELRAQRRSSFSAGVARQTSSASRSN